MEDLRTLNTEPIYPNCVRTNYNVIDYADTALRNYWKAKSEFQEINFQADDQELKMDMVIEYSRISVVFAAMCIEAFFNDYAAACLGDDEFYNSFDKLSPEGKFSLIAKFILKTQYSKGEAYYSRLKELFRERNSLVHSKSKEFKGKVFLTQKEIEALWDSSTENEVTEIDPEPFKESIKIARNGLCAMRDIAVFFDKHDPGASALAKMFMCGDAILDNNGVDVRNSILKDLKIQNEVI